MRRREIVGTRRELCGWNRGVNHVSPGSAVADVCILDCYRDNVVLNVQEDQRFLGQAEDPDPQLIAKTIAVFQYKCRKANEGT